nr:hypothetical protein [Arthrobacter sp. MA-N2]
MRHILQIRPDIIKLDRSPHGHPDQDHRRTRLAPRPTRHPPPGITPGTTRVDQFASATSELQELTAGAQSTSSQCIPADPCAVDPLLYCRFLICPS